MKRNSERAPEKGNVLWFILIGIVLLGGLTMILSRSGSNVDQSADVEQLRVKSAQLLRYAKGIETAIDQMKMRGVSENEINFENNILSGYSNSSCTTSDCLVFDAGGGGQTYQPPPRGVNDGTDWIFTSTNNVGNAANPIGTHGAGTGNDLVMLLPNINLDLCNQINRDLDIGTPGTIPVDSGGIDNSNFSGNYQAALKEIDGDGAGADALAGHNTGCFKNGPDDIYYFYFTILAR